jgi:hypothetical protein
MLVINPPSNYLTIMGTLPKDVTLNSFDDQGMDVVHAFFYWKKELDHLLPLLKYKIKKTGSVWISWPTSASKNDTDMSEAVVEKIGRDNGLFIARNMAFSGQWGALKFVWHEQE